MMKSVLIGTFALAACLLPACATSSTGGPAAATAAATTNENSMLTIITSPDSETQLMALVLTRAALQRGERPGILLCSAGGDLALKSPPAAALAPLQPSGASPAGLLRTLLEEGVKVEVCAIYLPNRPFGAEALIEGIGVAAPADIAEAFSASGTTILSF